MVFQLMIVGNRRTGIGSDVELTENGITLITSGMPPHAAPASTLLSSHTSSTIVVRANDYKLFIRRHHLERVDIRT